MTNIPTFVYWVIFFLIAVAFYRLIFTGSGVGAIGFPYKKVNALFSPAERSFLGVLDQSLGADYRVFGKVRIADVANVSGTVGKSAWQKAFNRISAKHFDFVVCKSDDLSIVCVLELNDKTHKARKRQDRDEFVAGVCNAIGVPLISVPAKTGYGIQEVRDLFQNAIAPKPASAERGT